MRTVCFSLAVLVVLGQTHRAMAVSIVTVGDSIVQTYSSDYPVWGWGQTLPTFAPGAAWTNLAHSGESTQSFIDDGRWADAVSRDADYMFIEFGNNDANIPLDPSGAFSDNLRFMVDQARAVGTTPILVALPASRSAASTADLAPYAMAMLAVAQEKGTGAIDLFDPLASLDAELGADAQAFLGPDGSTDTIHFGHNGATELAAILASQIPAAAPALAPLVGTEAVAAGQEFYLYNPAVHQFANDGVLHVDGLTLGAGQTFTLTGSGTTIIYGQQSYGAGAVLQIGGGTSSSAVLAVGVPEPSTSALLSVASIGLLAYAWGTVLFFASIGGAQGTVPFLWRSRRPCFAWCPVVPGHKNRENPSGHQTFRRKASNMTIHIDQETTVRDLVGRYPQTRPVFAAYGIDYCCGGAKRLLEVAGEHGLKLPELVGALEEALQTLPSEAKATAKDWYAAPLSALVSHIVGVHHSYMKTAMPRLRSLVPTVLAAHGTHHGELLRQVQSLFHALDSELGSHLLKEERVLFPYIVAVETSVQEGAPKPPAPFGSARNPIRQMEHEHESAGQALAKLREVTHDYALPADACPTFQAMYEELQRMEADLHQHIHLENNILFPRAIELEEACGRQP